MNVSISIQSRTESKSIYKAKYVTSEVRYVVVTVINMRNRAQGEEMTVNPQYQHRMQPVFCKSGVVGSTVKICTSNF